jgi:hypothetical protein
MNTIRPILFIALLLGLPATLRAAPTIIVGNHVSVAEAASVTIDVFVTGIGPGADSIGGLDLWVGIASQSFVAPPGEPKINGVDVVTGTIFAGNSAFDAPGQVLGAFDQVWEIQNVTVSGAITTDGKLFTIDINTLGVSCGIWSLSVFGVDPADGPFDSNYSNAQVLSQVFLGQNGTFGELCPEPSSFVMALIAIGSLGAAVVRRRISK